MLVAVTAALAVSSSVLMVSAFATGASFIAMIVTVTVASCDSCNRASFTV